MMSFEAYNKMWLSLAGLLVAALIGSAIYMQPHSGELTRMGGYLENDYGWNLPQEQFAAPLFQNAASIEDYDRYYDVVVFGDSFSEDIVSGWQNYLAARTGWSVISFNRYHGPSLAELLNSATYRNTPPRMFVYEIIERSVVYLHSDSKCKAAQAPQRARIEPLARRPLKVLTEMRQRPVREAGWRLFDPSPVLNYWRKALARTILGWNITEVHQFRLAKPDLFSNSESNRLLVITRDFQLKGVSKTEIRLAQCKLLELQYRIQKPAETAFVALVFPDKTSAYADFIQDDDFTDLSVLPQFENMPDLNIVKLNDRFDEAVRSGVVDLYLPDDTHCGYYGYFLAAEATLDLMTRQGWVRDDNGAN